MGARRLPAVLSSEPSLKHAFGLAGAHFADRLVRQAQQTVRIDEQGVSLRRETYGAPLAAEQPRAEMLLQLADARRHIGLDAIELVGCTDDAALVHDGSEDLQGLQVDRSHRENDIAELFICASWLCGRLFRCMRPDLDVHARLPSLSVTAACAIATIALAVAMGIGRFAFTPLLPLMVRDGSLAPSAGAWLAASNYLGYLAGALTASRLGLSLPTLMRASLAGIVVATAAMGAFDGLAAWMVLRFVAGVLSAWALVATSAWALQHLAQAGRTDLSGMVYAGVGLGIAFAGLFCLAAARPGVPASQLWLELGVLAALAVACSQSLCWAGRWRLPPSPRSSRRLTPRLAPARVSSICYGVLGFGYILPATFLPLSHARWWTTRRCSALPGLSSASQPHCPPSQPLGSSVMPTGCASGPSAISSWPPGSSCPACGSPR